MVGTTRTWAETLGLVSGLIGEQLGQMERQGQREPPSESMRRATRVLELVQRSARGGRLDVSRASALAARLLAQERVQRQLREATASLVERSLLRGIGALFGVVADSSSSHKNRTK